MSASTTTMARDTLRGGAAYRPHRRDLGSPRRPGLVAQSRHRPSVRPRTAATNCAHPRATQRRVSTAPKYGNRTHLRADAALWRGKSNALGRSASPVCADARQIGGREARTWHGLSFDGPTSAHGQERLKFQLTAFPRWALPYPRTVAAVSAAARLSQWTLWTSRNRSWPFCCSPNWGDSCLNRPPVGTVVLGVGRDLRLLTPLIFELLDHSHLKTVEAARNVISPWLAQH